MLLHKSSEYDSRVRREASALAEAGHEVVVVELARVAPGQARLDGFRRRSALPPAWMRRRLPFGLYRVAFAVWFTAAAIATRPEAVHAHDAAMLLPGYAAARLTGARLIYDSHELATSVPYRERGWAWFVAAIERAVVPRCDAVVTVSDGIAVRLAERYRLAQTPTVVRNMSALTVDGEGDLRARLGLAAQAPLVLHQGAPAPDRGCETLVDAVARLPGVTLVFLGDPEPGYGEQLSTLIRERGIDDRVWTLPSLPLTRLLANTAQADVGVTLLRDTCENHRLALPNKLFEYIAAEVPVVAGELPETARLVGEHGVGWCVPPDDAAAVAAALDAALRAGSDPALRERLRRAARELSWSAERGRLIGLYETLGRRAAGGRRARRPA